MTMARRAVLIWIALAAALALAAGAAWTLRRSPPAPQSPDPAVQQLFALNLPDADGIQRPLSNWRGKLLIVNFWATWCTPCIEEMPQLQRVADEFAPRNVALIGIGIDDADKIQEFRHQRALRFPLLVAGLDGMQLSQQLGNPQPVLPYTALISSNGQILEQHSGQIREPELRRWMSEYASP
jgi:thiol-disulfide isomerase/thioredoxin